jgi:hypothetical protein
LNRYVRLWITLPKFKIVVKQFYSLKIIQQQLKLVWLVFVFIVSQFT